jgi:membrane-associated protease RseP (regulator of RpoE activity)
VAFASAGSLMHGLMALALAWAALTFIGAPSSNHVGVLSFSSWQGHKENAAQLAGLKVGDQILAIDGTKITSATQLANIVHHSAGKRLTFLVEMNGHEQTLHATPVSGRSIKEAGVTLGSGGYIGIDVGALTVHESPLAAVPSAFHEVGSIIADAVHALFHVFSPGEFTSLFHQVTSSKAATSVKNQESRPVSIVGVVRVATQAANAGAMQLIDILVAVNVFVGVLNMLPMLPLDGGYVAIATYERLRSRRGKRYHADVNKLGPVIYAFMTVLLVLFACTLYLDIAHPITNPFG